MKDMNSNLNNKKCDKKIKKRKLKELKKDAEVELEHVKKWN